MSKRVATTAVGTSTAPIQSVASKVPRAWPASIITRRSFWRAFSRAQLPSGEVSYFDTSTRSESRRCTHGGAARAANDSPVATPCSARMPRA